MDVDYTHFKLQLASWQNQRHILHSSSIHSCFLSFSIFFSLHRDFRQKWCLWANQSNNKKVTNPYHHNHFGLVTIILYLSFNFVYNVSTVLVFSGINIQFLKSYNGSFHKYYNYNDCNCDYNSKKLILAKNNCKCFLPVTIFPIAIYQTHDCVLKSPFGPPLTEPNRLLMGAIVFNVFWSFELF